jgi:hypothetical protein
MQFDVAIGQLGVAHNGLLLLGARQLTCKLRQYCSWDNHPEGNALLGAGLLTYR